MRISREQIMIVNSLRRGNILHASSKHGWALVSPDGIATRVDGRAVSGLLMRGWLDQVVGHSMDWVLRPTAAIPVELI